MNIDYINDIKWIIKQLYYIIEYRKFNENNVEEMISLSIDLLSILQQYIDDNQNNY